MRRSWDFLETSGSGACIRDGQGLVQGDLGMLRDALVRVVGPPMGAAALPAPEGGGGDEKAGDRLRRSGLRQGGEAPDRPRETRLVAHQPDLRFHQGADLRQGVRPGGGERAGDPADAGGGRVPDVCRDSGAKAIASRSELLARRFAPCSPVPATSPQAQRPGSEDRPRPSTRIPPMW